MESAICEWQYFDDMHNGPDHGVCKAARFPPISKCSSVDAGTDHKKWSLGHFLYTQRECSQSDKRPLLHCKLYSKWLSLKVCLLPPPKGLFNVHAMHKCNTETTKHLLDNGEFRL